MFKPENIYLIQGHGDTIEKNSILNSPFGKIVVEYERFQLPENVFTASSREVGLNTPPDTTTTLNLIEESTKLPVPPIDTYKQYTKGLRDLGKDLFTILVERTTTAKETWNVMQSQYNKGEIPKIIHTHGHIHPDFNSLPITEQKRDLFLFTAPNDWLDLGTKAVQGSFPSIEETTGLIFDNLQGYFPSGIIPLDELSTRDPENINVFRMILPKGFASMAMNKWEESVITLSDEIKKEWKRILSAIIINLPSTIATILDLPENEFCKKLVAFYIQLLKDCYYWTTTYSSEAAFLENTIYQLQFKITSQEVVEKVLDLRRRQGKPNEPILFIFYHCRTIRGDKGDVYNKSFSMRGPAISRLLSTMAATENNSIYPYSDAYHNFQVAFKTYKTKLNEINSKPEYKDMNLLKMSIKRKKNIVKRIPFTEEELIQKTQKYENLKSAKNAEFKNLSTQKNQLYNLYQRMTPKNKSFIEDPIQQKFASRATAGGGKTKKQMKKQKRKTRRVSYLDV